eukprot:TRINITY_DN76077_c0_g1_i1.p1 TRINITY_DN76077_c0_g1~~TRINITY_DN76077_c0_g1_i1.p1  ORF type:complete len:203 (-),score=43.64 TRINITY_DN76077_c0_g1_i1:275-883(-)
MRCKWLSLVAASTFPATSSFQTSSPEEQMEYFSKLFQAVEDGSVLPGGCSDAETLLPALKTTFERAGRQGILVDVGANLGDTSVAMLEVLGQRVFADVNGAACDDVNPSLVLYAFEPNPEVFPELRKRLDAETYRRHRVHLRQAALNLLPGNKSFFYASDQTSTGGFVVSFQERLCCKICEDQSFYLGWFLRSPCKDILVED